jgi:hypothetical protein
MDEFKAIAYPHVSGLDWIRQNWIRLSLIHLFIHFSLLHIFVSPVVRIRESQQVFVSVLGPGLHWGIGPGKIACHSSGQNSAHSFVWGEVQWNGKLSSFN